MVFINRLWVPVIVLPLTTDFLIQGSYDESSPAVVHPHRSIQRANNSSSAVIAVLLTAIK